MKNSYNALICDLFHNLQLKIFNLIFDIFSEVYGRPYNIKINTLAFSTDVANRVLQAYRYIPKIYGQMNRSVMDDRDYGETVGDFYNPNPCYRSDYSVDDYL